MFYIRTKDNHVYEVVGWDDLPCSIKQMHGYEPNSIWVKIPSEFGGTITYQSYDVMKQDIVSDSCDLKDLIDAYIVVRLANNSRTVYKPRDFRKTSHRLLKCDIADGIKVCYVGVWRNDSLIPVAMMNEKGELELL